MNLQEPNTPPIPAEQTVNARLLEALRKIAATNASKHGTQAMMLSRCVGIATDAIAAAESQAGPVRLTDEEIDSCWT